MNITRKTYGVYNVVEWVAKLHYRKVSMNIPFSGGSITTQGVVPATFTTANPVTQLVIEGCPQFKSGQIQLIAAYDTGERMNVESGAAKSEPTPAVQEAKSEEPTSCVNQDLECVSFATKAEAASYIRDRFGIPMTKLRNVESIVAVGHECGLEVTVRSEVK